MNLSRKTFDQLVEEAIASLPEEYAQWLDEVAVIVEDHPGKADRDLIDQGGAPLGAYDGTSRLESEDFTPPPRIMIYREPLLECCQTREELAKEIRKTLVHELGHHAGMEEEEIENHGYGPIEEDDIEWDVEEGENR